MSVIHTQLTNSYICAQVNVSIMLFVTVRFVSSLIAIYKPAKAPIHRSHSEMAGAKPDLYRRKQIMLCTKFICLKLIKCKQRNWSRFKQILKKSPHKQSASYKIDWFEADGREARGTTNNELSNAVVLLS